MDENRAEKPEGIVKNEKITPVMIYSPDLLIRGQVITPENVRVSIWLRTQGMPEYIHLKNANVLIFGVHLQNHSFTDYILPTQQVAVFHILPPASEPLDYDEAETNRKMEPVTLLVGSFKFNGLVRISAQSDLATHLSVNRSPYLSVYDIEITNPSLQAMGTIRVPMCLVRPSLVSFANRI